MSLKPIANDEDAVENRSLRMYAHSWNGSKITADETDIKTGDGNGIDYSTPDLGQPNYSLHTDGAGNVFWSPDATTGGDVIYDGSTPITVGTITKYSDVNGLSINNSVMIETATELQVNTLRITDASDPINDQDVVTKKYYEDTLTTNINNEHTTTGVNTGGIITLSGIPNASPLFNISDGSGIINNLGVITKISWTGLTGISRATDPNNPAPYNGILTYISINNLGQVIYSDSAYTNEQQRDQIFLGVLVHITSPANPTGQNLTVINNQQLPTLNTGNQIKDVMVALGFINISGNLLSGSVLLTFQKSIGYMLGNGINYYLNIKNPHTLTLQPLDTNIGTGINVFQYRLQDGTSSSLTLTDIIPNKIDDGNPYVTGATYGNNRWGVNRVYCFTSQALKIQPPQFDYNTAELAIEAIDTEGFQTEPSITANGLLIGYIVTRGGANDLNLTGDARFLTAGKFGSGVGSVVGGTQDLQSVYDNSTNPEITTDATRGGLTIQRGSALDTDIVLETKNGAGTNQFTITGEGVVNYGTLGSNIESKTADLNICAGTGGDVNLCNDTFTLTLDETNNTITSDSANTDIGSVGNPYKDIYLSGSLVGSGVVSSIQNVGTTSLVASSTGDIKGLVAGTSMSFITDGSNVTLNATTAVNTLQESYDASTPVEILTDATNGGLTIQRGSALDTDNVLEVKNGSGNDTFNVRGDGSVYIGTSPSDYNLPNIRGTNNQVLKTDASGNVSWQNDADLPTNLSEGATTTTTVDIDSSTGTNATIQPATTIRAGVMSKAKFDEVVINNAKVSNVTTDLSEGTSTFTSVNVNSSDGLNANLLSASTLRAGVMSKAKFDEVVINNAKVSNVTTNLSVINRGVSTLDVASSDGVNATLPASTVSLTGLMSSTDKTKLDGIEAGAETNPELTKSIYLFDPTATDDIVIWQPGIDITIQKVVYQISGGTNVSFNINVSGGTDVWVSDKVALTSKTSNASIGVVALANLYVRYQASAITGTPTSIYLTITYTEN